MSEEILEVEVTLNPSASEPPIDPAPRDHRRSAAPQHCEHQPSAYAQTQPKGSHDPRDLGTRCEEGWGVVVMGLTLLTCMTIQTRGEDVKATAGGPTADGKWAGHVALYRGKEFDRIMLSTGPVYDSEVLAVKAMDEVLDRVRKLDLKLNA